MVPTDSKIEDIKKMEIKCPNCDAAATITQMVEIDKSGSEKVMSTTTKCDNCGFSE